MPPRPPGLPREVIAAAQEVPLLIRTDASAAALRDIIATSREVENLRVAFAEFGDMPSQVQRLAMQQPERDAEQVMIHRLASVVPGLIERIVSIAIMIAKRRSTVAQLAQACKCSRGMLHYRLQCLHTFDPRDLLAEFTALHVAWRRGVLGWTSKKTALETGYHRAGAATALDHFVRHNVGVSLREMGDPDCFWMLVDRSARRLSDGENFFGRSPPVTIQPPPVNALNIL
jgi:hypothetical protein